MQFDNTQKLPEIDLLTGLKRLETNPKTRLYSDGLENYEYMYYDTDCNRICYEDNTVIGRNAEHAYSVLQSLKWVENHKFYLYDPIPVISEQNIAYLSINWFDDQTWCDYFKPVATATDSGTVEFPPKKLPEGFRLYFSENGLAILEVQFNQLTTDTNEFPSDIQNIASMVEQQNISIFIIR